MENEINQEGTTENEVPKTDETTEEATPAPTEETNA